MLRIIEIGPKKAPQRERAEWKMQYVAFFEVLLRY